MAYSNVSISEANLRFSGEFVKCGFRPEFGPATRKDGPCIGKSPLLPKAIPLDSLVTLVNSLPTLVDPVSLLSAVTNLIGPANPLRQVPSRAPTPALSTPTLRVPNTTT